MVNLVQLLLHYIRCGSHETRALKKFISHLFGLCGLLGLKKKNIMSQI